MLFSHWLSSLEPSPGAQCHAGMAGLLRLAEGVRDRYWLRLALESNEFFLRCRGEWGAARDRVNRVLEMSVQHSYSLAAGAITELEMGDFERGLATIEDVLPTVGIVDDLSEAPPQVWRSWGVSTITDWGRIVFLLVDNGMLNRQDSDTIDASCTDFDFEEAFVQGYRPELPDDPDDFLSESGPA